MKDLRSQRRQGSLVVTSMAGLSSGSLGLPAGRYLLQGSLPPLDPKALSTCHRPVHPMFSSIRKREGQLPHGIEIKDFENEAEKPAPWEDSTG